MSLNNISGKANISYAEIQGSNKSTLKIMDKDVMVSLYVAKYIYICKINVYILFIYMLTVTSSYRADVTDYRFPFPPVVKCWHVPFKAVMNGEISDFTVTQL